MYTCAHCAATAEEPTGWFRVLLHEAHYVADAPVVPFVASGEPHLFFFHVDTCRDAWLAAHDLPAGPR